MTDFKKFPDWLDGTVRMRHFHEWRVDTAKKLEEEIAYLNSEELKKKSWDTWVREYTAFQIYRKKLDEFLECLEP